MFLGFQARGVRVASFDQLPAQKAPLHFGTGFSAMNSGWNNSIWANASRASAFTDGAGDPVPSAGRNKLLCLLKTLRLISHQIQALIPRQTIRHLKARQVPDLFYPHLSRMAGTDARAGLG